MSGVGRHGAADQLELAPVPELHAAFQVPEPGETNDVPLRIVIDAVPVGCAKLEDGFTLATEEGCHGGHEPVDDTEVFRVRIPFHRVDGTFLGQRYHVAVPSHREVVEPLLPVVRAPGLVHLRVGQDEQARPFPVPQEGDAVGAVETLVGEDGARALQARVLVEAHEGGCALRPGNVAGDPTRGFSGGECERGEVLDLQLAADGGRSREESAVEEVHLIGHVSRAQLLVVAPLRAPVVLRLLNELGRLLSASPNL